MTVYKGATRMERKLGKRLIIFAMLPIILAITALTAGVIFHIQDRRAPSAVTEYAAENPTPVLAYTATPSPTPIPTSQPTPTPQSTPTPTPEPYISEYGRIVATQFLAEFMREIIQEPPTPLTLEIPAYSYRDALRFHLFNFTGNGIPEILINVSYRYYYDGYGWEDVPSPLYQLFVYIHGEYQLLAEQRLLRLLTNSYGQHFMAYIYSTPRQNRLYYMSIGSDGLELEAISDERISWHIIPSFFGVEVPRLDGQWIPGTTSARTVENEIWQYLNYKLNPSTPHHTPIPMPTPTPRPTPMLEPHISEYGRRVATEFLYDYIREFIAFGQLVFVQDSWENEWLRVNLDFDLYDFNDDGIPEILITFRSYDGGFPLHLRRLFIYTYGEYQLVAEQDLLMFYSNNYGQHFMFYTYSSHRQNKLYYMGVSSGGLELVAVPVERVDWRGIPSFFIIEVPILDGQWLSNVSSARTLEREIRDYLTYKLSN